MKNSRKLLLTSLCGLAAVGFYACGGGENGIDGKDGASCTISNNEDGTATISCPNGSSFTVKNGEDGQKGDAGSDGEKGQNGQSCKLVENSDGSAAVVCPYDGSSYIVRGNTDNYANYCKKGFWGKNCENECNCQNDGICNDGVTGDGSCSCKDGWSDEDCSVCPAGFYDGVTDCVDCTKGGENSAFGTEKCIYSDTRTSPAIEYPVVTIGDQLWMAENLRIAPDSGKGLGTDYFYPDDNANNVATYGYLYTWDTAQNICPDGWKLPEQKDFEQLLTATGAKINSSGIRASSWENGFNSSGFGALPAGYKHYYGVFYNFGSLALFWSATPCEESNDAYRLYVRPNNASMDDAHVDNACSVRCLRDSN